MMQAELEAIDVTALPELAEVAERVKQTGVPLRLVRGDEELAVVRPAKRSRRKNQKGQPTSADDPIWSIVGIAHSGGPGDVSTNKHKYLAEAYMPKQQ